MWQKSSNLKARCLEWDYVCGWGLWNMSCWFVTDDPMCALMLVHSSWYIWFLTVTCVRVALLVFDFLQPAKLNFYIELEKNHARECQAVLTHQLPKLMGYILTDMAFINASLVTEILRNPLCCRLWSYGSLYPPSPVSKLRNITLEQ